MKSHSGPWGARRRRPLQLEPLEKRLLLDAGPVVISEFMAKNGSTLLDVDGDYSDWIELHNTSAAPVNLAGWHLTDDAADTNKWTFPNVSIPANGYLVVFASDKNRTNPAAQLHLNFKLSTEGEYLGLFEPDGAVAFDFSPAFQEQYSDISYGGDPGLYYFDPTPGAANGTGTTNPSGIEFSRASGVFDETFQLTLTPLLPGGTIRYSLNGAVPTWASPAYTGQLTISMSTVVRAKLFTDEMPDGGGLATASYVAMETAMSTWDSNLPVIVLDTHRSTPNETSYVTTSAMFFEPPEGGRTGVTGEEDLFSHAAIKIRGSTSATFPKKMYSLELQNSAGDDWATSLFGLPSESDWVLNGPYSDKTLMRNYLSYNWSTEMGQYAPRTVFCEVFLNQEDGRVELGDYVGVYVLIEKIKIDENRIDIQQITGGTTGNPQVTGGAILKVDRQDPDEYAFTAGSGTGFVVHEPEIDELNAAERSYLVNYIAAFEAVLYGSDFDDPDIGYAAWIDVDSFIDEHILVELTKNIDGYRLSNYYYFDDNTKLTAGPVWDYNLSLGNCDYLEGNNSAGWYYPLIADRTQYPYYTRLFEDPEFAQRYRDRWAELRATIFETDTLVQWITDAVDYIGEAETRDHQRWPTLGTYVWPNGYVGQTYADEINYMTQFLTQRLAWMDSQFLAVPAFSREDGDVEPGETVMITVPGVSSPAIYYTTDGSDPRLPGGGVSTSAHLVTGIQSVNTTLVPMNSVWRYNDTGTDLETAWREPGYYFGGWPSGSAELGYGDGDEAKVVGYGGDPAAKHPTTYFVKSFDAEDVASFDALTLELIRDDGAVVYLNGQEIARSNMSAGTIEYETLALLATDDGETVQTYSIDPARLVEGTNYLAVEVHQTQLDSSDLSFNLRLRGMATVSNPLVIDESVEIKARRLSGSQWSGLTKAVYDTAPELKPAVTEIMYHPADPSAGEIAAGYTDSENFEFIELYNPHGAKLSLAGIEVGGGIAFDFSRDADRLILAPDEFALVVRNRDAFEFRYGPTVAALVVGEYSGKLDNAGEQMTLMEDEAVVLADVTYGDDPPWPTEADGDGSSLEARLSFRTEADPAHWFASATVGGTPGWLGAAPVLLAGDANLDDQVNQDDAAALARHWGATGATWVMGDFSGDGRVNAADASILAANWGAGASSSESAKGKKAEPAASGAVFVGPRPATESRSRRRVAEAAERAAAAIDAAVAEQIVAKESLSRADYQRLALSHVVARRQSRPQREEAVDESLLVIGPMRPDNR